MHATRYIHYIYIVAIAFLLQGCHRDSHPSAPDTDLYAISMSPSEVRGATRALINNVADLQAVGFKVYGYKEDKSGDREQVFAGQEVTYRGDWEYTPIRYWDCVANYSFAAYAPASVEVVSNTEGNHTLKFTVPHWQAIDGTDIIVATSQGPATEYLDRHAGTVKLDFVHILAQLEVQIVRNAFLTNTYKLTGLSYNAVPQDNAATTYTLDYTTPASSAMDEVARGVNKTAYTNDEGVVVDPEAKAETTFKHLVVPFEAATDGGLQIVVNYTVAGAPRQATVNTGVAALEAGKRYVLKLTFNSGLDITPHFEIADWIDEDVDEDPKYNW